MKNKRIFILNETNKLVIEQIIKKDFKKVQEFNNVKIKEHKNNEINFWTLSPDEIELFYKHIVNSVYSSFEVVPTIKLSNMEDDNYFEKYEGKVDGLIYSLVNKYWDNGDQIRLVAELLVRITHAHIFSNGNKRTGLISAYKVLDFYGFNLKFSNIGKNYVLFWENFMLNVSCWKEKEVRKSTYADLNEEGLIDEVYKVIISNLFLN